MSRIVGNLSGLVLLLWFGAVSYYVIVVADSLGWMMIGAVAFVIGLQVGDIVLDIIEERVGSRVAQTSDRDPRISRRNTTETCASCGEEFSTAYEDHGEIVDEYYCRDCAEVGKAVMENYREWMDTTEDVRDKI